MPEPAAAGLLALALGVAVWRDLASYRIPNAVVGCGLAAAVGVALLGSMPLRDCLLGLAIGFGAMLPFHLLRSAGAGDVKLMAMVGAFLGPIDTIGALCFTWIAGGLAAIVVAAQRRSLRRLGQNLQLIGYGAMAKLGGGAGPSFDPRDTAARVPYAVAIAIGTGAWLAFRWWLA
ncbi:MAG TPA: prepilin peptidase [Burkholderiales bacterium]|nr:prepilin peptidase [Burkholderiales bacterium]